ncbi:YihY/virulence factor BrkB family protein, partial [candidate division KSB1 bacterium]|nr:YihY/virulence factor BrkB family protein [candidate division KSB1 bacterium]NIR71769.1 YihY/virulence factor BrkB family protein [candidate division KSB1 bacterium]NIS24925.1 YihY/virulence factor BrkB family protein [candidate division KSB1 bacterium]NIT71801.1 YihY/virulence factor BrkB family protein [candidate division KSB1 bacterium]NIU25539.1 YihY/virulence factor BrkB family protein [candidate division KSB1 bacterium]
LAAGIFGIGTLLFGASAVFVQLREAINTIWRIEEKPIGTIKGFVKARFLSFSMVLGIGFLLVVSLTISTVLSAFSGFLGEMFPGLNKIVNVLDFFISFAVITVLFALIFRILPNAKIRWKDIWVGSAFISLLFTIGKLAIGFYLGRSDIASTFGAASSLVIVMLWAFYSAQIFLFGAEFTKTYANRFGSNIVPDKNAVKIDIQKVELKST